MQRTLLTLALVAAAGTAIAQTSNPPAAGTGSPTTAPSTPSTTAPSADAPAAPSQTMGAGGGATAPGMNQPTGTYDTNTADTNTANAPGRMSGQAGIAQKRIEAFVQTCFDNGLIVWPNTGHANGVDGIHFYTLNKSKATVQICKLLDVQHAA